MIIKKVLQILIAIGVFVMLFIPFAVSNNIMFGTIAAKYFFFQFISITLILISILYILIYERKTTIIVLYPDLFLAIYFVLVSFNIYFTDKALYLSNKFINLSLLLFIYFIARKLWVHLKKGRLWVIFYYFALSLMVSSSIQAIIGIVQFYGFKSSYNANFMLTGSFGNPAPFAFFLGAVFPFALSVYFLSRDNIKNQKIINWQTSKINLDSLINNLCHYISLLTMALTLIVLPVTMIRASWIMAIAGSFLVIFNFYKSKVVSIFKNKKNTKGISKIMIIISIVIFFVIIIAVAISMYKLKKASADGRVLVWQVTFDKIKEKPLFGQGFGDFKKHYNHWQADWFAIHPEEKNGSRGVLAGTVNYAYNEFLEMASEIGLTGTILFIFFIISILFPVLKQLLNNVNISEKYENNVLIAFISSSIAILICSFVSFPFYSLPTYLLFFIFLAFLSAGVHNKVVFKININHGLLILLSTTCLLTGILLLNNRYKLYNAYRQWELGDYFIKSNNFKEALKVYKKQYPLLKHEGVFLQQYGKVLSLNNNIKESIDKLNEASKLTGDVFLYTTLGENYTALKQYNKAEHCYIYANNMSPKMIYPQYLLVKMYYESGEKEKARRLASEILNKPVKIQSKAIDEMREKLERIKANAVK